MFLALADTDTDPDLDLDMKSGIWHSAFGIRHLVDDCTRRTERQCLADNDDDDAYLFRPSVLPITWLLATGYLLLNSNPRSSDNLLLCSYGSYACYALMLLSLIPYLMSSDLVHKLLAALLCFARTHVRTVVRCYLLCLLLATTCCLHRYLAWVLLVLVLSNTYRSRLVSSRLIRCYSHYHIIIIITPHAHTPARPQTRPPPTRTPARLDTRSLARSSLSYSDASSASTRFSTHSRFFRSGSYLRSFRDYRMSFFGGFGGRG